ncbi:MAG: type II toxin-antitoxin system RelE/ParE family toxin [Nitrococcus sp.]|nr:type II toxin-antitoxin system RelE/ParE family toxin [Nitrococcus sp.]
MATIIYSEQALADLNRLTEFLLQADSVVALETVDLIIEAVEVLANHPLIGHLAEQGLRELVISRGKSGYLALYSYELEQDAVLVLSIRHQREAGYVVE